MAFAKVSDIFLISIRIDVVHRPPELEHTYNVLQYCDRQVALNYDVHPWIFV